VKSGDAAKKLQEFIKSSNKNWNIWYWCKIMEFNEIELVKFKLKKAS
jgi:hypothetical protein